MATAPQYAATPHLEAAVLSSANSNRDGTGTLVDVVTAGANGTKVDRIIITATATTTVGMIRLYAHDGSTSRLLGEMTVTAVTPSATAMAWQGEFNFSDPDRLLMLKAGWKLRASTEKAETFHVIAFGGEFSL